MLLFHRTSTMIFIIIFIIFCVNEWVLGEMINWVGGLAIESRVIMRWNISVWLPSNLYEYFYIYIWIWFLFVIIIFVCFVIFYCWVWLKCLWGGIFLLYCIEYINARVILTNFFIIFFRVFMDCEWCGVGGTGGKGWTDICVYNMYRVGRLAMGWMNDDMLYVFFFHLFCSHLRPFSFFNVPPYLGLVPIKSIISGIQLANIAWDTRVNTRTEEQEIKQKSILWIYVIMYNLV